LVWQHIDCNRSGLAWARGHIHTALPKELIKESLKDAPVRVHAALDGTNHEVPLVALGYHYSQKTILLFIMTKDS